MLHDFAARMLTNENCNLLAGIGVLFVVFTSFAFAHEGATGVIKERMDLMKGQQKQMKLIGEMAKSKKKFDAAKAAAAARDLSKSTQKIPDLFPEGSNGHPSDALDAVWKEWDRFRAMPMTRKPPPMRWPRLSRPRARIGRSPSRK